MCLDSSWFILIASSSALVEMVSKLTLTLHALQIKLPEKRLTIVVGLGYGSVDILFIPYTL